MQRRLQLLALTLGISLVTILVGTLRANPQPISADVTETLERFRKADPTLDQGLKAVAYAVYPSVKKGGLGIGAARGTGQLIENGMAAGKTALTQGSIGLQAGGQEYSELIIFETAKAVTAFKEGKFALSAQVSAVAITAGSSANAKFTDGVQVLTLARQGLMYEASVGGQKFSYDPY